MEAQQTAALAANGRWPCGLGCRFGRQFECVRQVDGQFDLIERDLAAGCEEA
jgi:hypothetical protein